MKRLTDRQLLFTRKPLCHLLIVLLSIILYNGRKLKIGDDMNILVIEDDAVIRKELKILLEKNGYTTWVTEDFNDVVKFSINKNPHLILLDLNLPVYDGYHICREIRKSSKVPIVVVTSRDSDIDELMSMSIGADDFITKPYNTQILLARIASILNRVYSIQTSNKLSVRDLVLDVGKSTVENGEGIVELTKNEVRILALLIKNQGIITSRDDIINELWQSNEFVDDNTLTVNINRLRTKLTEIGAVDFIKTKRGQGYLI